MLYIKPSTSFQNIAASAQTQSPSCWACGEQEVGVRTWHLAQAVHPVHLPNVLLSHTDTRTRTVENVHVHKKNARAREREREREHARARTDVREANDWDRRNVQLCFNTLLPMLTDVFAKTNGNMVRAL